MIDIVIIILVVGKIVGLKLRFVCYFKNRTGLVPVYTSYIVYILYEDNGGVA